MNRERLLCISVELSRSLSNRNLKVQIIKQICQQKQNLFELLKIEVPVGSNYKTVTLT